MSFKHQRHIEGSEKNEANAITWNEFYSYNFSDTISKIPCKLSEEIMHHENINSSQTNANEIETISSHHDSLKLANINGLKERKKNTFIKFSRIKWNSFEERSSTITNTDCSQNRHQRPLKTADDLLFRINSFLKVSTSMSEEKIKCFEEK